MILAQAQTINLADYILPALPLLMLALFLVFAILPMFRRALQRNASHMEFMRQHSQRIEEQLARITALLEQRGGGQPPDPESRP